VVSTSLTDQFFDKPILNSPYECPPRHWELDGDGQPTNRIVDKRRRAEFITPIPKPKKRRQAKDVQKELFLSAGDGVSTETQQYDPNPIINSIREQVAMWRQLPSPSDWRVTPETARLLQHWRQHPFQSIRPFFCQVEAVETAIWLAEVALKQGKVGQRFLDHIDSANGEANPELLRVALKLATGAGKTTVMAMLIAWQTINAVRHPQSKRFTRGFLIVTPGITIRDRLRVLQPNDPDSYYASRELVPNDMLADIARAKIVITNYHAFKLRERLDISKVGRSLLKGRGEALDDNFRSMAADEIERYQGILGESVELNVKHLDDMRQSTILFHLTKHLLYTRYRDPNEEPKLHLFGELKWIVRQWLEGGYLRCTGGTTIAQVLYQEIKDIACDRVKTAIDEDQVDDRPIKAILDAYNPTSSTTHVSFTTSKETRWQTDPRRCQINWVVCDSDWEAEFCRVAEAHPRVHAYVKNHNLGLEVPYLHGSTQRKYLPDFVVQIDDGRADLLNLIVEIKGYRGEDAKEKASTMRTYWIPGVNNLGSFGRWAFAEFVAVFEIEAEFNKLIAQVAAKGEK
jgi:Type III restriction enzyme, res subunit/Endonuclease domain